MKFAHLLSFCTLFLLISCEADLALGSLEAPDTSTAGTYANMLVIEDFMYVINDQKLKTFSLQDVENPTLLSDQTVGFNMESLFHHKGSLFLGSPQAMYIYEIGSNGIPKRASVTEYQALGDDFCFLDPIAANNQNAYASLATNALTDCSRVDLNEIQVFDIQDLSSPKFIARVQMDSPRGIALDKNLLFVTEAEAGLKVLDVTSPTNPKLLHHFDGFQAFDVIANNGILIVVGPDMIYEYDYSNVDNIRYLSEVEF